MKVIIETQDKSLGSALFEKVKQFVEDNKIQEGVCIQTNFEPENFKAKPLFSDILAENNPFLSNKSKDINSKSLEDIVDEIVCGHLNNCSESELIATYKHYIDVVNKIGSIFETKGIEVDFDFFDYHQIEVEISKTIKL